MFLPAYRKEVANRRIAFHQYETACVIAPQMKNPGTVAGAWFVSAAD